MSRRRTPGRSRSRSRSGGRRRSRGGREWIGGLLTPPFFIEEGEDSYRASMAIWMELPSGLVVGQEMVGPEDVEGAIGRALLAALRRPLSGSPRRPDAIRVANESLVAEVVAAVAGAVPVAVAPTPELDRFLETMLEAMPVQDRNESYLEGGRIAPAAVAELFTAAEILYQLAPWKLATDDQVLRLDIPELDVEAACVCIIGNRGESLGLLIFPSLEGYESFRRVAGEPPRKDRRLDLGTGWLALNFERGADLPALMRREVADHGWPVAEAGAYPQVVRVERDGATRPLTPRDLKIAAACATSLCSFFAKHGQLFENDSFDPLSESYFDEEDLEVRLTVPYEAFSLFEAETGPAWAQGATEPRVRSKLGRNDPCPCGSGRKYKKCHLSADEAQSATASDPDSAHALDGRMVRELSEFASERFGDAWFGFVDDFVDTPHSLQIALPWSVYHYRVDGTTAAEAYLEEQRQHLSSAERAWLAAQQAAWLSVWEVTEVEPGQTVTLRDLLSSETRRIHETSASQTLVARDAVIARVVDFEGVALLCGMHPCPLPPIEAADVVRRARGRLRRKRAVPVERLREDAFGRYLIRRWEEAVSAFAAAHATPPVLQNTDGDPLLFTTDHFKIAPGARPAVAAQLAALEGAEPAEPDAGRLVYDFLRAGHAADPALSNTVIGRARISDTTLELETNSRKRADALRKRVEAACGEGVRHRAREHADPLSARARLAGKAGPPAPPPPEADQIIREFKQRHYADWPDHPLPALNGKTPREAAQTAQGRASVDVLLKDMENHEQRAPGGAAFDFSDIRRALGLD